MRAVDIPAKVKAQPGEGGRRRGRCGLPRAQRPAAPLRRGEARRSAGGRSRHAQVDAARRDREDAPHLGSDGDEVRGALERDFADYAKQAVKANASQRRAVLLSVATPFAARAAKTAAEALFKPDAGTIAERVAGIRERADQEVAKARETAAKAKAAKDDDSASGGA